MRNLGAIMINDNDKSLRDHLLSLLNGAEAHVNFEDFVGSFPVELCGEKIDGLPYTPWQVLEHIRIAQWDILQFSRDAKHVSPKWPEGYWPAQDNPGTPELWQETIGKFRDDLEQMESLVADPASDLFAKIPHGIGQTLLRETLLIADHNSYHLGALLVMGRLLKK
jgi:DinB superfamily